MIHIEGRRGGSSTPSYKEAIASRGKKPLEKARGTMEDGKRNMEEEIGEAMNKENNGTKDKEENDKKQGTIDKNQKGPCKPKAEITPRVILNNLELQVHREHM